MTLSSADRIDQIVHAEMSRSKTPGVAVLVIRNGKIIKRKGYGVANLEHHTQVRADTVFQSGSMGKQFTATLVMMLVQEGRLSLDDSIVKFFPEGKGLWDGVNVRHLLSHTSGIGDMPYDDMDMRKDYSEKDLVKLMSQQPITGVPGEKWEYNNGGYVLLGILVHRVTGKFYGELMRERIFDPLGMKTARVISEHDIVPNRAAGYEWEHGKVVNQEWVAPSLNTTADGSLYLSLFDMMKWDAALYKNKLLKANLLGQMWSPAKLIDGTTAIVNPGDKFPVCYGFGWTIRKAEGCTCIAHAGGWQGFKSYYARVPEKKLSVVVLANLDVADTATIGKLIIESYEPKLRDGRKRADSRIP